MRVLFLLAAGNTLLASAFYIPSTDAAARRDLFSTFDEADQRFPISPPHQFIKAGPNDHRGPCPGLNSLANHGFISRSGVDSFFNIVAASNQVYRMGIAASTFAGVLGLFGGNLLDPTLPISIGEPPSNAGLAGLLPGLLAPPSGLTNTHNQFECDASLTRCDLYLCNDAHTLQPQYLEPLLDLYAADPSIANSVALVSQQHANRINDSIAKNGLFFFGPVQMVVGAFTALQVPSLFANYSAEHPEGFMSVEGLMSIYGASRASDGTLTWSRGSERIPDVYYRRPGALLAQWDLPILLPQVLEMWLLFPETLSIGGNLGEPNTFVPLDLGAFTHGAYSLDDLRQPGGLNLICFIYQLVQILLPDLLGNVNDLLASVLTDLGQVTDGVLGSFICPRSMGAVDLTMLNQYPGWVKSQKKKTLL
ncbi:Chloroperoxidase [Mycena pura]|uniref:Chloroperoxidase n=1 Tax=Mycena pura TaxID=153505 RepID=A0AAD6UT84_9AGAR|nr:Chloroperoxidase [Mycena pura]